MTGQTLEKPKVNLEAAYRWQEEAWRMRAENNALVAALVACAGGTVIVPREVFCDAGSYILTRKENPKSAHTTFSVEIPK